MEKAAVTRDELDQKIEAILNNPMLVVDPKQKEPQLQIDADVKEIKQLIKEAIESVVPERVTVNPYGSKLGNSVNGQLGFNHAIDQTEENTKRLLG